MVQISKVVSSNPSFSEDWKTVNSAVNGYLFQIRESLSVSCLFHAHLVIMYGLCDNKYV